MRPDIISSSIFLNNVFIMTNFIRLLGWPSVRRLYLFVTTININYLLLFYRFSYPKETTVIPRDFQSYKTMNIDNTLEMSNRKSPRQPQQPYNMFNAQDNRSPIDIDVSAPVDQQTINASLMFAEPLRSLADLLSVPALQFYQRAFVSLGYGDLLTLLSLHETQWTSVLEEVALEALKSSGIEMLPAHRQLIFSRLKTEKMRRDTITKQHYDKTFLTDQVCQLIPIEYIS